MAPYLAPMTLIASSRVGLLTLLPLLVPVQATAHPHIFVDAGLTLIHDSKGRVTDIEVRLHYDELFSLLLLEDMGLDPDYDGVLTADENETIVGFDLYWPEGFEGDVYIEAGGAPVPLGPPEAGDARLEESGQLYGAHRRKLARPVDPSEGVVIKVYDPTFYTAYSIVVADVQSTAGCGVPVFTPDLDEAYGQLAEALAELGAEVGDPWEMIDFPPVGDRFAEEVRLDCGSSG
ncbi:MAG: DUF1007 family protein [Pseudomonadota bacterium]